MRKACGFDSSGNQLGDDELVQIFPFIHFKRTGKEYDEDGNLTNVDKDYSYYNYLDTYVKEGDFARGNKPQMVCANNLHNDGCQYFHQRFLTEMALIVNRELTKGTNIETLRSQLPAYFTLDRWNEDVSESVQIHHFKLKTGATGNYPQTLTATEYSRRSSVDKQCYDEKQMYKLRDGRTSSYGSPVTEATYNSMPEEEQVKYIGYKEYDRKSFIKGSYSNEITWAEHNNLSQDEMDILYMDYIYYETKTQTTLVYPISAKDPNGSAASDLQILKESNIKALLEPLAKEAATKAADAILQYENKKVGAMTLTSKTKE